MSHFYYLDLIDEARPLWEVPYADPSKGMRKANLGDARKFNAVPSPNTIMQVEAKPGLVRWSDNLLLAAAYEAFTSASDRSDRLHWREETLRLHKEAKEAAANEGTAIHTEIERALKNNRTVKVGCPYHEIVCAVLMWLGASGIEVTAIEKYFVNRELGFGGMIDVLGFDSSGSNDVIVDWKSTTTKNKSESDVTRYWKDKAPLIAAYAMGYYGSLDVECWNVFPSRDEPGRVIEHQFSPDELKFGWKKFQHCYELWVMDNDFDPRKQGGSRG